MADGIRTADSPRTLIEGQRLNQRTFHTLYEAMPPGTRAELIDGVVYMPSPVGPDHARLQVPVVIWLDHFAERTPGVEVLDNPTTILGWNSETQPDALLRILPGCGGQSSDKGNYVHGAPELVVEVSKATRYIDLGPKLAEYQRAGVLEYVVCAFDPDEVHWFGQVHGLLVEQPLGVDGLFRSMVFPGLWLDPRALIAGDRQRLREVVDLGCATPEHAAFVQELAEAGGTKP